MGKYEFSKIIAILSYLDAILLSIFMCYCTYLQVDTASLSNVVIVAWAEVAATNSFYYWKAMAENKIKIAKSLTPEEIERMTSIQG